MQAHRPSPDKSKVYTPKLADAMRPPAAGALSADTSLPPLGDLFVAKPELPAGVRFSAAGGRFMGTGGSGSIHRVKHKSRVSGSCAVE